MAIAITRQDESASELRRLARAIRGVAQARRLLAIALVMEGHSRMDAATAAGNALEIWFWDQARVGQKGTLAYVLWRCGTRPRAVQGTRYAWAYLFGAVCPGRAVSAGLVMPHADTEAMNLHLAEIGKAVALGASAALVLDGAGWHGSDKPVVPDNITSVKLPPYAPELNPIENVWACLRGVKLAHRLFSGYDDIVDACCQAWNSFVAGSKL